MDYEEFEDVEIIESDKTFISDDIEILSPEEADNTLGGLNEASAGGVLSSQTIYKNLKIGASATYGIVSNTEGYVIYLCNKNSTKISATNSRNKVTIKNISLRRGDAPAKVTVKFRGVSTGRNIVRYIVVRNNG